MAALQCLKINCVCSLLWVLCPSLTLAAAVLEHEHKKGTRCQDFAPVDFCVWDSNIFTLLVTFFIL